MEIVQIAGRGRALGTQHFKRCFEDSAIEQSPGMGSISERLRGSGLVICNFESSYLKNTGVDGGCDLRFYKFNI